MNFTRVFEEATPRFLDGLLTTIEISILAIIIGLVLGVVICFMVRSKSYILKGIASVYVWCIRGTPMIVQALLVFFGIPQVIQLFAPTFRMDAFTAGLITLALNAGAYMSEIFRGGIAAVDPGQIEASRSLGISQTKTMLKIVLPQAFKISVPSLVNQFIITIKDSSILTVIGLNDITNNAKVYAGATYIYFPTYIVIAGYYLVLLSVLMILSKCIEKKLNIEKAKSKHRRRPRRKL